MHQPLEGCGCITQSEWHAFALKETQQPHSKGGILLGCLIHLHLPETQLKVKTREYAGPLQALQHLLDVRKGVAVFLGSHIQLPEIYAKVEATILFPDQHNCVAPGAAVRSNSPCLQHIVHMCPDLLQQWWRDVSKLLFKGLVIGHLDVVLDLAGTPQLIVIKGEYVMILHQQFTGMSHLLLGPLVQA